MRGVDGTSEEVLRRRWHWFRVDIERVLSVLLRIRVSDERCSSRYLPVLLRSIEWFPAIPPCWLCSFPSHSKGHEVFRISSIESLVSYFDLRLLFIGILRQFFQLLQSRVEIGAFLHDLIDRAFVRFDFILALLQIPMENRRKSSRTPSSSRELDWPTSIGDLHIGSVNGILKLFHVVGGLIEIRLRFCQSCFVMLVDSFGHSEENQSMKCGSSSLVTYTSIPALNSSNWVFAVSYSEREMCWRREDEQSRWSTFFRLFQFFVVGLSIFRRDCFRLDEFPLLLHRGFQRFHMVWKILEANVSCRVHWMVLLTFRSFFVCVCTRLSSANFCLSCFSSVVSWKRCCSSSVSFSPSYRRWP